MSELAGKSDRREALEALRDRLAREIDACESARDIASLSARFMETLAQLEGLAPPAKGNPLDELKAKRDRGSDSPRVASSGRRR